MSNLYDPNITIYVDENGSQIPTPEFYAGSAKPDEYINFIIYVWNNRLSATPIRNAYDCAVNFIVPTEEDSYLFNYFKLSINGVETEAVIKTKNYCTYNIGNLSGDVNDGSLNAANNYKKISVTIGPINNNMQNGLKNIIVGVNYDTSELSAV